MAHEKDSVRLRIKVHAGAAAREHLLELPGRVDSAKAAQGRLEFFLDGKPAGADWAEISPGVYSILVDGRSYEAQVSRTEADTPRWSAQYNLTVGNRHYVVEIQDPRRQRTTGAPAGPEGPQEVLAPMPGKVVKILVSENQQVGEGQGLLVIEAMKMQNELRAPRPGRVERVYVLEGSGVEAGFKLLRLV